MALTLALTLGSLLTEASASHAGHGRGSPWHSPNNCSAWDLKKFTSLVTFGDSYTDDSRAGYFAENNGTAPPVGYDNPVNYNSASGGRAWPQYVKQYSGINLYNYAVSGAVCSNTITPRNFYPTFLFPSVEEYEVPAFEADSKYIKPDGTKFMYNPSDETVYSIWIGTNDLGNNALLTDSQVKGTNIVNYTDCVYDQLKRLYDQGGRYFVLQNVAPLNLAPMYATLENGGMSGPSRYWPIAPENITQASGRMMEQVVTVNAIYEYQTPFVKRITKEFEDARFAVFDMHALISDIYYHPALYLNGSAPLNVQSYTNKCNVTGGDCVRDPNPDSFLWFDALHPSEQTDRVIAREFVDVVKGGSKWARYW
ncbi:Putative GDSL lipase/esterase, SGNH hydrolase superfamily [Septoria linicola]|uniref:GDSL lipase/esterase, SGNH hydrolase superfamily n=1 Tax=Septoria linicola TaxID=215465 RepID=A0A9Q9ARY5_9PEZI|nr:Putative GDSL lipase/esterase, SGNH hydrolase superfamily [Septoria linicola]